MEVVCTQRITCAQDVDYRQFTHLPAHIVPCPEECPEDCPEDFLSSYNLLLAAMIHWFDVSKYHTSLPYMGN